MVQKLIILPIICFLISTQTAFSQSFKYFDDSKNSEYLETSWMELTPPSELERKGTDLRRFPVESLLDPHLGINCLRLQWKSATTGNWYAIASKNWAAHNINNFDSLSFWAFTNEAISSQNLPSLFLEDTLNRKSSFIQLSQYHADLPVSSWIRITVPLNIPFTSDKQLDWTVIKTVGFAQNLADNKPHTLLIDDIRIFKGNGYAAPASAPTGLAAKGYDSHCRLTWNANSETNLSGYEIYRSTDNGLTYKIRETVDAKTTVFNDFVRELGTNLKLNYKIRALNDSDIPSLFSEVAEANTHDFTDDELLTMVEEATFRYFWDYSHPGCGIARERNSSGDIVTLGGSGFGIMAILVGIERGFITRTEGAERMLKIVNFLSNADRFHGAWPHWMNGNTGKTVPFSKKDNGGDLLETALMMQGLLAARGYFNNTDSTEVKISTTISHLWETVEWDWYRKNNSQVLYWHWSPDYGWQMNMPVRGWNECMIVYLLAIASPTHGVPATLWKTGWTNSSHYVNGKTYYGHTIDVGWDYGGPLFFTQFSFTGFDPHSLRDSFTNYFENNRNITLVNHDYCVQNPKGFKGYSSACWGISASDDPVIYYLAHEPNTSNDNGTITPTAALSAMVYTPEYSIAALKYFYRDLGNRLWDECGFYDAFNQKLDWYATSYLAIDEGTIIAMIENYRSGLIWKNFMLNPEIQKAIQAIGFVPDGNHNIQVKGTNLTIAPNPVNSMATVSFTSSSPQYISLNLYNQTGQRVDNLIDNTFFDKGIQTITIPATTLPNGFYFLKLTGKNISEYRKIVVSH